jgi:hypothetical protein
MTIYAKFKPDIIWSNIVHNYRVPRILISAKNSVIYRRDVIEGLISAEVAIYSVEADPTLMKKINNLSEFDKTDLERLTPKIDKNSTR